LIQTMSAPPSPHILHTHTQYKKKDRPPALDIPQDHSPSSDGEIRYQHADFGVDLDSQQVSITSVVMSSHG
jgi:hypothetical protein